MIDVIIIGGGASALACAVKCARGGKKVTLLEKEAAPCRKILVSGNGRCNFTNANAAADKYFEAAPFLAPAFEKFTLKDCLNFFDSIGLLYQAEGGRYFPLTGKASSVGDCLLNALKLTDAQLITREEVVKITKTAAGYKVTTAAANVYEGVNVVLACGSLAYPQVGGSEAGYKLADSLGHSCTKLTPALCAINLKEAAATARIAGIKVNANITLLSGGAVKDAEEGEIIFGAKGISGNNVSSVSRNAKEGDTVLIDFLPRFTEAGFKTFAAARAKAYANLKVKDFLCGMLADSVANLLIDYLGVKKQTIMADLKADIFDRIIKTIKAWPFTVQSLRPWKEANAAKGGIKLQEVAPATFESKKQRGLYITGELLDVDGRCGGYNLHFAWLSGILAASAIIKE